MRDYRPIDLTEADERRFWAKVALPNENGCALWTATCDRVGYGRYSIGPKVSRLYPRAHRVSYTITNGPIPDGMQVDHMCHTPACVAPIHLRTATSSENCQNRAGAFVNSATGVRGVCWNSAVDMWQATATVARKQYHLGNYPTIAEAEAVVVEFRRANMPYSLLDRTVSA